MGDGTPLIAAPPPMVKSALQSGLLDGLRVFSSKHGLSHPLNRQLPDKP